MCISSYWGSGGPLSWWSSGSRHPLHSRWTGQTLKKCIKQHLTTPWHTEIYVLWYSSNWCSRENSTVAGEYTSGSFSGKLLCFYGGLKFLRNRHINKMQLFSVSPVGNTHLLITENGPETADNADERLGFFTREFKIKRKDLSFLTFSPGGPAGPGGPVSPCHYRSINYCRAFSISLVLLIFLPFLLSKTQILISTRSYENKYISGAVYVFSTSISILVWKLL